ncbi:MAG: spermidine/putrescine ABC transporter ATP-binding protein [Spirochaetae bacterium HGW-Spirochaetae-4]|jgi:putative spermidine/putrescine transport system permease protein|nr:MAG: spermidine/putrescine ABC transporter ATP-binding protein [Spirochaetes bacterium GWC2_52_13]OHD67536.1 MAG: spermidine/putrescine ABC transporter ATP-binding protein [Spirochaetes bacterium GWF2_52_7]PKL21238.1 MAG: spermidine/putrescine ABC transporter ATP-binding protein [Spirochaetae bacterium HGW-Spirochaetae-4]HCG63639.1 spermidine/putrescine ABC transporter ATP-binding protein [Sphaerochaeta sp.]
MKNSKILILITALVFIFLIGPFIMIFLTSFSSDSIMRFPPKGFTLAWYTKALNIEMFRTTFWVSLKTGLAATATALILGVPVAYANIRFNYRGKNALELLFSSPAIVPGMVIGFSLLRFFVYVSNIPIGIGLYLGHTAILFPYTVRVVSSSLRNFEGDIEQAAISLGSTPLHAFFAVVLPNIQSGLVAAFILAFITSFNNVPVSLFLTGPGVATLPIQMLSYMEYYYDPTISALSSIIIVLTVIVVQSAEKLLGISKYV